MVEEVERQQAAAVGVVASSFWVAAVEGAGVAALGTAGPTW